MRDHNRHLKLDGWWRWGGAHPRPWWRVWPRKTPRKLPRKLPLWLAVLGILLGAVFAGSLVAHGQDTRLEVSADGSGDDAWVEDQYAIAAQHYRQQRWAQAIGQFRLLLDRAPRHARASLTHFFLAESHVQLEQYAESLPHFQQFLALEPDHSLTLRAQFRLGESHYLLGEDDASIQVLTELLQTDRDAIYTEYTLAYLGEMELREESPEGLARARDYLQQMVRDYPESALRERALMGLSQASQKLGDSPTAERILRDLQSSSDPLLAAQAAVSLAALWIEAGRPSEVQSLLPDERIAQLPSALQSRARYWRGRAEMAAKNWSQAAAWIQDSLPGLSDDALEQAAIYDAAISHWQAEQIEQAEQGLNALLSRWPDSQWAAEAQYLLLQAAIRRQAWERVDTLSMEFLAQFPQHALAQRVREGLGRRALGQGDYALAQAQFRQLIDSIATGPAPELSAGSSVEPLSDASDKSPSNLIANGYYLLCLSEFGLEQWAAGLESCDACLARLSNHASSSEEDRNQLDSSAWLEQLSSEPTASAETGATPRTAPEQLWEQAQFARLTALLRLRRWPEALQSQETLLRRFPDSPYREAVWSERLRILAADRAWSEYVVAAGVAQKWLQQPPTFSPGSTETVGDSPEVTSERGRKALRQSLSGTALQMAEHRYQQGDYAAAIPWYELARQAEDPVIVDQALAGLAWAEFQTLPPSESERTARLLLDRFADSPRSAEVGLKLAEQMERAGRSAAAAELLETLIKRFDNWPRRHQLLALQGKILAKNAQMDVKRRAIAAFESAIEAVPSAQGTGQAEDSGTARVESPTATYLYELAWVWHELGESNASQECFQQINLKYPQSRYWADATFRLAQHQFSQQRYGVANDLLAQLLGQFDSQLDSSVDDVSDGVAGRSVSALTISARRDLGETSALAADRSAAVAAGGDSSAESDARVTAELHCQTLYLRAMTAAAEQDWMGVATWSQRLIDRYPDHRLRWMTQYWHAEAEFRQRQYASVVTKLSEILPRTPTQSDSWVAMSHLRLAQSLGHLSRWREASEIAETARGRFTSFAQAFEFDYLIGRAQADAGRFPAARAAYQQVLDAPAATQSETAAMAQWMIGETYMHQEQYALAAEAYHRVETLHRFRQWQAAALLQAGKCYEQLGRTSDAVGVYRQLLREHADCSLVDTARARLENLTSPNAQATGVGN